MPCEATPGQYSNTLKNFHDHAAAWIEKRFSRQLDAGRRVGFLISWTGEPPREPGG